jgi:MFS transporter, DHA1 family, tetracycline resistance protein
MPDERSAVAGVPDLMKGNTIRKPAFRFVFVSALMSATSFSIVLPILPNLVRDLGGGDIAAAAQWMMLFASVWGVAQIVSAPLLGGLSDRYGRRPVLLISSLGLGLDYALMAIAPNLWVLLFARIISGATAASFATAHAYVADITDKENRAEFFGKLASSISIGYLIGPVLGGWLGEIDLRLPYIIASLVTLSNWLYGFFVLPESLPAERRAETLTFKSPFNTAGVRLLFGRRDLRSLSSVSFLYSLSNMLWGSVWVLFCAHRFGWSPLDVGIATFASGAAGIVVQTWAIGRVVRRVGEKRALQIGAAMAAISLAYVAFAPNTWWYAFSVVPAAFSLLVGPGLQGLISSAAGPQEQGAVRGGMQALSGIATVVGPLLYGAIFTWSLTLDAGIDLTGAPVLLSSLCMMLAFFMARRLARHVAEAVV